MSLLRVEGTLVQGDAGAFAVVVELDAEPDGLERAVPLFREAFRAYGLPVGEGGPEVAARHIGRRPAAVREAVVAALDEWHYLAGDPKFGIEELYREWLRAVLEAAESDDAWGRKMRAARRETDQEKRQAALEALA